MKIKKIVCIAMCVGVIGVLAGCGENGAADSRLNNTTSSVEEVLQAGISDAENSSDEGSEVIDEVSSDEDLSDLVQVVTLEEETEEPEDPDTPVVLSNTEGIDIDLTILSSTMVYSEVYDMLYVPEDYVGKTIKMDGLFTAFHDDSTGNDYYTCIIEDATACCAQGIEFELTDDYVYPEDYPQEGEKVSVVGVFDTYMEGDYQYCTLRDASLVDE